MQPIPFEGSFFIGKPKDMTDEQCMGVDGATGITPDGFPFFRTCWKPSYEDIQAINRGEPVFLDILAVDYDKLTEKLAIVGLRPHCLYTLDEQGNCNDAG